QWKLKNLRNFAIGQVLKIKKSQRRAKNRINLEQCLAGERAIELIGLIGGAHGLELMFTVIQRFQASITPMAIDEFAVESGKEPGFGLGRGAQLMALGGEFTERFLRKVPCLGFAMRERKGKPIKRLVMRIHDLLERCVVNNHCIGSPARNGLIARSR